MRRKLYAYLSIMLLFCATTNAQSLKELLSTPFVGQIVGAKQTDRLVFTVNDKGHRNVYSADAPSYAIKKLTSFDQDDAQEITSLSISYDGKWIVFVRGGDHGANSAPVATNSASLVEQQKVEIFTYSIETQMLFSIGIGDNPIINPDGKTISYIKSGEVWSSPIDKINSGKRMFHVKGAVGQLQWSPTGEQLAFVSRRGDHSFIGIFAKGQSRIQWIAPSYYMDSSPRWSPDGKKIAFIRNEGTGGALDSLTAFGYQPWSIQIADLSTSKVQSYYQSPAKRAGTFPRIAGQANLQWRWENIISFISFEDGWPHLYKIDISTKKITQLTKGNFTVDQLAYSSALNKVVFSANYGPDQYDFDRSHLGWVDVLSGKMEMLTQGEGLEMAPFFFNDNKFIGYKSSTYRTAAQPAVLTIADKNTKVLADDLFDNQGSKFVKPEQVFVTAEDGVRSSGQLFKPAKGKENGCALVYIHGGPRRQMYLAWHHSDYYSNDYVVNQYLTQLGYTVLAINYRLGTGYGFDFQHADHAGVLGASEYLDIKAAGLWLSKQKNINPQKIGLFGGSYGGYLTAMGLAKDSDLFKVGVDIHGVHNRMRKQNPDFYAPDFAKATALSWESSPSKWVNDWRSPVLLIHGDDDQNVAFSQSIDLYNRLKKTNVDVEALILPDENHHWQLFENLVKVKEATVDFLQRKLK